jgi:hypothetical protein
VEYLVRNLLRDLRHIGFGDVNQAQLQHPDLEPHVSSIAIKLTTKQPLFEILQKGIVKARLLKVDQLLAHNTHIFGRSVIVAVAEALGDEILDDLAQLAGGVLDLGYLCGRLERPLEFGNGVLGRDSDDSTVLTEEGVDVEARDGFHRFALAFALRLRWDFGTCKPIHPGLIDDEGLRYIPFFTSATEMSLVVSDLTLATISSGGAAYRRRIGAVSGVGSSE